AEMLNEKSFGKVELLKLAKNAPATPPKNAPLAYAQVFVRISGMPIAAAAISSSRIATHARPSRESRSRMLEETVVASRTRPVQKYALFRFGSARQLSGRKPPVASCSVLPKPGGSTGVI